MRHADTQAFHDISLVCRAGYDIGTLTPLLCRLVRIYIGAAAVGIFWMDGSGKRSASTMKTAPSARVSSSPTSSTGSFADRTR